MALQSKQEITLSFFSVGSVGVYNLPIIEKIIEDMQRLHTNPKEHFAVVIWSEDDVLSRARERGTKITREQAQEIIDRIHRKHNASLGISWDTIDTYLDDY